jgi:arsenate reductase (glutaredoxin)
VEYVNYLEHPLSADELKRILRSGGLKPQDVLRTREDKYKKLVEGKKLSDDELIRIMAANPEIIQRPLVVRGKKAVLARPVERLKDLGV